MKLSMSLLAWYLRDYQPECAIGNDQLTIGGARFLPDNQLSRHSTDDVFFGSAESFFSDPAYHGVYLMVHRQSMLFFRGYGYEELFNALLAAFDYFNDWEDRLQEAAIRRAPIQEFVDIAAEVIQNSMVVGWGIDHLAHSEPIESIDDPYWQYGIEHRLGHPATYRDTYLDDTGALIDDLSTEPTLVRNVYPGGDPVMMLYLKEDPEDAGIMAILQTDQTLTTMNGQLAPFLARYLCRCTEYSTPDGAARTPNAILRDVLDGIDVGANNLQTLDRLLPPELWRLCLFHHVTRNDQLVSRSLILEFSSRKEVSLHLIYHDTALAIVEDKNLTTLLDSQNRLLNLDNIRVGISMPGVDTASLPACLIQAEFALENAADKAGSYRCEEYAFDYLIGMLGAQKTTTALLHPALGVLERYDQSTGNDLRKTLGVYLHCARNKQAAVQQLHVHPNTLKYRLKRIQELTGLSWEDENDLNYLTLSNWLEAAMHKPGPAATASPMERRLDSSGAQAGV